MMHPPIVRGPLRALAVSMLCALAGAAIAAPVTVTKTPKIVYLFVSVTPPAAGKAPYVELFHTDDQAACDAQAADWSALLALVKSAFGYHS